MKYRRRKTTIGYTQVALSVAVLAIVIGVIWALPNLSFFEGSQGRSDLCGYVLSEDLLLDKDIFCPADSLENLPRENIEPFIFYTESSDVTIDCRGFAIRSEGGIGLVAEHGKNITLKNCRFEGIDLAIIARDTDGLQVLDSVAKVNVGGVQIANGINSIVKGNDIQGADNNAKWGIEIIQGRETTIEKNTLSTFRLSAINFYSSRNFKVLNNRILKIGDTGIGIFSKDGHPASSDGLIIDNRIEQVQNVGAFEVMHGSSNLMIAQNEIDNARAALYAYKPLPDSPMRNITFSNNRVTRTLWPVTLKDCREIRIEGNTFAQSSGGGLITIKNTADVKITNNLFELNNGSVTLEKSNEDIYFTENSFVSHFGLFFRIDETPTRFDLSKNHWDGCAQPSGFKGVDFPKALNPVFLDKEKGSQFLIEKSKNAEKPYHCVRKSS